jgi:hypothetical protein
MSDEENGPADSSSLVRGWVGMDFQFREQEEIADSRKSAAA